MAIDIALIGQPREKPRPISVYLNWDRYSALLDHIWRTCPTMEVPLSEELPEIEFLPRVKTSSYDWPDRYVIKRSPP